MLMAAPILPRARHPVGAAVHMHDNLLRFAKKKPAWLRAARRAVSDANDQSALIASTWIASLTSGEKAGKPNVRPKSSRLNWAVASAPHTSRL